MCSRFHSLNNIIKLSSINNFSVGSIELCKWKIVYDERPNDEISLHQTTKKNFIFIKLSGIYDSYNVFDKPMNVHDAHSDRVLILLCVTKGICLNSVTIFTIFTYFFLVDSNGYKQTNIEIEIVER